MKFLHTADWQIGKPYARLVDRNKRALLQAERFQAVHRLAEIAQREDLDFVVVAGDLFDSNTVDNATVSKACAAIGKIPSPVFAIPGNHDHGGAGCIWSQPFFLKEQQALAPNLQLLDSSEPIETESAILLPCPLQHRADSADTTIWLRDASRFVDLNPDKPRIVIAHGSIHSFTTLTSDEDSESEATNLLNLDRLPLDQIDYIALGDWHGTKQAGEKAWYSGTPEPDRFQKGEANLPGNALLVEVSRGSLPTVSKIPTARLHWRQLEFRFSDDDSLEEFDDLMQATLGSRVDEDLVRLDLSGTLGIDAATRLEGLLESMEARLLRLKLVNDVQVLPNDTEIEKLTNRVDDPVISTIARKLVEDAKTESESSEIARLALRELYAACRQSD